MFVIYYDEYSMYLAINTLIISLICKSNFSQENLIADSAGSALTSVLLAYPRMVVSRDQCALYGVSWDPHAYMPYINSRLIAIIE
jgi:hypothetical protein